MNDIKFAVSQNVIFGILTVKFSDGSVKYYNALEMAVQWFKMSNDEFYNMYGFNFNPCKWGNLYERARRIIYQNERAQRDDRQERQQAREQETLQTIACITSPEFAKTAADVLGRKNRVYDFEWYLVLQRQQQELISAGIPNDIALDIAQIDIPIDIFISSYKPANAVDGK